MELQQLRAFIAIADTGTLTSASAKLYASQPAVSAQIKALEQSLGVDLFVRTPKGMTLTEAGERLLPEARAVLTRVGSMERLAGELLTGVAGTLTLGINNDPTQLRIDQISAGLFEKHPQLHLSLWHAPTGDQITALRDGRVDAGFAEGPIADRSLYHTQVSTNRLHIIAPADWAEDLADADWSKLQNYPWCFVSPQCSYFVLMRSICERHGLTLKPRFTSDNDLATIEMVRAGLALSIADISRAAPMVESGELFVWPHFEFDQPVHLCMLKERRHEPALDALLKVVRRVFDVRLAGA
ncbi:LysR family transcriptional regulator [Planctomycetales bacterium ZRK34]|nr:LysR family transcriptional regulator [Planctomycetales bacterium ZRK34]